jgi:hypothetical protein
MQMLLQRFTSILDAKKMLSLRCSRDGIFYLEKINEYEYGDGVNICGK